MKHIISIVLFILAVVVFLFSLLVGNSWLYALVFGGIFLLLSIFFYRRGK